jgi:hypothetical protein
MQFAGSNIHVRLLIYSLSSQPKRWEAFWDDMGASEVLALDMVENNSDMQRILSVINRPQRPAPARSWCMNCKATLGGTHARALHCGGCGRLICGTCAPCCLPAEDFPKCFEYTKSAFVCVICERILSARKDDNCSGTQPTSSYGEDEEDRFSC